MISSNKANNNQIVRILVCIPAYNEAGSIANIVNKAKQYCTDVVVYDDGSFDNTDKVAEAAGAIVFRSPLNKGYGAAIKALFAIAKNKNADIMVTMDSDGQHDAGQIPDIIEPIMNEGFDIVIGSRFIDQTAKERVPAYRSFGVKTITKFAQVASYNHITDAQSGFRAYNKNALSQISLFEDGMAVSTEILLRAKEKTLKTKEVPITISYNVDNSSTHNPISHGIGVLYSIFQYISLRHPLAFYGLPGVVLLIVAAGFMSNALQLFSATRYISTNMILVSIGTAVVGTVLVATGAILYTMIALLRGRIKEI